MKTSMIFTTPFSNNFSYLSLSSLLPPLFLLLSPPFLSASSSLIICNPIPFSLFPLYPISLSSSFIFSFLFLPFLCHYFQILLFHVYTPSVYHFQTFSDYNIMSCLSFPRMMLGTLPHPQMGVGGWAAWRMSPICHLSSRWWLGYVPWKKNLVLSP